MQESLKQIEAWYSKALAQLLLKAEKQQLDGVLSRLFGYYLLELGGPPDFDLAAASPIHCRVRAYPEVNSNFPGLNIASRLEDLPFADNAIDVVLLTHVLEFSDRPQNILQEVKRVLIPEGYAIIFSFNPSNLWKLPRINGRFHRVGVLRQWLEKNELSVINYKSLFFMPFFESSRLQSKLLFLEAVGQLCWPFCGAVNMIVVKKKRYGVRPIRLSAYAKQVEIEEGQVIKPTAINPSLLQKT